MISREIIFCIQTFRLHEEWLYIECVGTVRSVEIRKI